MVTDEMRWYGCEESVLGEVPPGSAGHRVALIGKSLLYVVGGDAQLYVLDTSNLFPQH